MQRKKRAFLGIFDEKAANTPKQKSSEKQLEDTGADVQGDEQPENAGEDVQRDEHPENAGTDVQGNEHPENAGTDVQGNEHPENAGADVQGDEQPEDTGEDVRGNEQTEVLRLTVKYRELERDILRLNDCPGRIFLISCENQSQADYDMPVRELSYDGVEYTDQLKVRKRKKRSKRSRKSKHRTPPLTPVFHLVLYTGEKRWCSRHRLSELMALPKDMEEFRHLLPEYQVHIFDIHDQNPELFHTEWRDIFRLMGKSRKTSELKKYVEEHMEELQGLSRETRLLLSVLLDQYEILDSGEIEVKEMCKAWDGAMLLYKEEGRSENLMQNVENAMKNMKWDLSTACRVLGSSTEEYHKAKETLLNK